jgi:hypothetical protein
VGARFLLLALVVSGAFPNDSLGQPAPRRATNIAALRQYPGFYHRHPILVVGTVNAQANQLRVGDESGSVQVVFTDGTAPEGIVEVRGEFWDIGQMNPDDSRLSAYDLRGLFGIDPEGPWPRPGQATAIIASSISPAPQAPPPTIRSIVLNPSRYVGLQVTVTGQFSGRNLLGELPDAPGRSRYDFVLRSADAAIWVANIRPRGKDQGRDFELGLDARIDTARWLTVSGTLQQTRGLLWIDAQAGTLAAAQPAPEVTLDEPSIRVPAAPPPEVMFSAPTQDETDVSMGTTVRIQFTRDIDPATLKDRVRVGYLQAQTTERGEPSTPIAEFTTEYAPLNRVLELTFTKPLERFRTVKVELLEGILGTDQQPLKPWTLTFDVGGS